MAHRIRDAHLPQMQPAAFALRFVSSNRALQSIAASRHSSPRVKAATVDRSISRFLPCRIASHSKSVFDPVNFRIPEEAEMQFEVWPIDFSTHAKSMQEMLFAPATFSDRFAPAS